MKRGMHFILAAVACLLALIVWKRGGDKPVEGLIYNWKCRIAAKDNLPSKEIVVVKITDRCLQRMEEVGRWPWPRPLIAGILEYCGEARAIGVDVVLSEHDQGDQMLGAQIGRLGNVVSSVQLTGDRFDPDPPLDLLRSTLPNWPSNPNTATFTSVVHPVDEVMNNSAHMGYVNFWRGTVDGSHRLKLATQISSGAPANQPPHTVPSLALATFMVAQNLKPEEMVVTDGWLKAGSHRVRIDTESNLLLSWKGREFDSVEANTIVDSINAEMQGAPRLIPRKVFKDKIVLIGADASGLPDREVTPVNREMSGVYIHATAIDNLLKSEYFRMLPEPGTVALILAFALLPAFLSYRKPAIVLLSYILLAAAIVAVSVLLAVTTRLMVPTILPMLALTLSTMLISLVQWSKEQLQLERMENLDVQKQRFTDMLVHDLKNTVAPVLMSVDLVRRSPDGEFASKDFPYYVEQTYNQLLLQVNSILDIRRMEEGRLQIDPQLASPLKLVRAIRKEYEGAFERMELYMDVEEAEEPHTELYLDEVMFRRVLENLIWNAIKYASNGTPIDVFCGIVGPHYEVRIANKCRPINAEKLDQIFGRYVVGNAPRTIGNITSSGLGLAFCKLAVEAHNGTIVLSSPVPGRKDGFQVEIRLPLRLASDLPS